MPWVAKATDDFNRSDNASLGANWTNEVTVTGMSIASNKASPPDSTADHGSIYTARTWISDQYSKAVIQATGISGDGVGMGLLVRASTAQRTEYRVCVDNQPLNNMQLARFNNAAFTGLAAADITYVDGSIMEVRISGTVITVIYNGITVITFNDGVNTLTSGSPGICFSGVDVGTNTIDNWEGGEYDPDPTARRGVAIVS